MGGRCDVAFLHDFVKKNEKKKGSQLKLSSSEMKGLKAYKDNYKEGVAEGDQGGHGVLRFGGVQAGGAEFCE